MTKINDFYFKFRNLFALRAPRVYHFCDRKKSIVKFMVAGCFAGGSHLIFLAIFYDFINWPIIPSTSFAFIISFVISFSLQKLWTFRNFSQKKVVKQFSIYLLNAFLALNLNGIFMHLLVDNYDVWYLFSQIIVNLVIGAYNFFLYRFVIFKPQKNEISSQEKEIRTSAGDVA